MPTITTIIFLSFFFSYAISPLVDMLNKRVRLPRWLSTTLIMSVLFFLILLLTIVVLPVVFKEVTVLLRTLPEIFGSFIEWLRETAGNLGVDLGRETKLSKQLMLDRISDSDGVMKSITNVFSILFQQTFSILGFFVNLIIFTVISFFTCLKLPSIYENTISLFPKEHRESMLMWLNRFDRVLSGFIRGQLTVGFVLGSLYALGLTLTGLENGGSFGAMIGLFCIVPYVGLFSGFTIVMLMALSKGGVLLLLKVVSVFVIIQIFDTIFITPNIMGRKVGISPVLVIIALFAGAELGGFLGILVAVPTFAILKLISEDMVTRYRDSDFFNGDGAE